MQRGGEKPVGGRAVNDYYRKQGSAVSGNLAGMSERYGAVMPCGLFLLGIEGVGEKAGKAGFGGEWDKIGAQNWTRNGAGHVQGG